MLPEGESQTNEGKGRGHELLPQPVRQDSVIAEHAQGGAGAGRGGEGELPCDQTLTSATVRQDAIEFADC